ncbi:hypothetical protein KEM56_005504 [Ascosphaera pollenicola]|nr:hypothetical protein KEM56_005504 [Ascosphaera pollenicola]
MTAEKSTSAPAEESTSAPAEEGSINLMVKTSNDTRFAFTLPLSTTVLELKQKLAPEDHANCPLERQRLIYSGRVLRDPESLASYNVKDGNTIHLVRSSAPRPAAQAQPGASSASAAAPGATPAARAEPPQPPSYQQQRQEAAARAQAQGVPTNIATGPGNDPENLFTSARYAGLFQMPGAGAFAPGGSLHMPQDPEEMARMLENPQMQSMMNEALSNPDAINAMLNHPMMPPESRPMMRMILSDPNSRRMLTDPNFIRMSMNMRNSMGGGPPSFPAPGTTSTMEQNNDNDNDNNNNNNSGTDGGASNTGATPLPNPFAGAQAGNPFASLFGAPPAYSNTPASGPTATPPPQPPTNPLDPSGAGLFQLLGSMPPAQQMQFINSMMGAGGPLAGGAGGEQGAAAQGENPLAALFGGLGGGSPAPQDTRPPEERYASQLSQLNDMGFFDFDRNVAALRASGGNVNGAVEYLLSHP